MRDQSPWVLGLMETEDKLSNLIVTIDRLQWQLPLILVQLKNSLIM